MATAQDKQRGRPPLYPWDKWLKPGSTTILEKGEHFDCQSRSMELLARRQVQRRGLEARVSGKDGFVTIKVA